ncbi:hypothetical protein THAOC_37712 [Thalassiosira oceanica]|uniref:Uncharacterized protein n=1 Tax=Thalassiosira oceanica TaxID=159749 RepID=K0RBF1_THAOC|nr:hypothetical protein THAOC_37712 [Thalassiosira oceanica]|eukprot:EJK43807.1 hypothetical protein THAOC_37712 [Thalassiosira oceanica]
MAQCPDDAVIFFSKFDIQDGFWRMINEVGKEYNFAFVMPTTDDEPLQIVVPSSLQMGWVNSPNFFSGASETARDVADDYAEAPIGALPEHHLEKGTAPSKEEMNRLLATSELDARTRLQYLIEVYMDDFIAAAQAKSPEELKHISRAVLHAIHDVFPEGLLSPEDQPVSVKKILKGEAQWSALKEILGWIFDGETKQGTPFKEFQKLMGKLYHASIGAPAGRGFMTPLNHQLAKTPKKVWFRKGSPQRKALQLWKSLLLDVMREPTLAKELVPASPDFVGLVDASGEGTGGVWLSGKSKLPATAWRLEWPPGIKDAFQRGELTINDLEMAGNLLGWLVLEGMGVNIKHRHVALLNDNSSAVSWILSWAAHSKGPAGELIMALAIRQRVQRASPLTPAHLPGELNAMADCASRSFGYKTEWKCESNDEFLTLFNRTFPLPEQADFVAILPPFLQGRYKTDPYLVDTPFSERMHHITSFGGMVRQGCLGRGKQIRVESVRTAITAIAQTIALDRGETPLHNEAGEYHLPLKLMLDGFAKEDPPSEKKLAVGVDIPEHCCRRGNKSAAAKAKAIGDLILIAFYFLLRVGEYTVKATRNNSKQTVQFRGGPWTAESRTRFWLEIHLR